jgi:hypothetical protein
MDPSSGGVSIVWIEFNDLSINRLPNLGNLIHSDVVVPLIFTELVVHSLCCNFRLDYHQETSRYYALFPDLTIPIKLALQSAPVLGCVFRHI